MVEKPDDGPIGCGVILIKNFLLELEYKILWRWFGESQVIGLISLKDRDIAIESGAPGYSIPKIPLPISIHFTGPLPIAIELCWLKFCGLVG